MRGRSFIMLSYLWISIDGASASVDSEEKVNGFLPDLEKMIGGGLVPLEKIKVIHYRHERPEPE
jgi:hypothetical protein